MYYKCAPNAWQCVFCWQSSSRVNAEGRQFVNLLSVEVSGDELVKTVEQMTAAKVRPGHTAREGKVRHSQRVSNTHTGFPFQNTQILFQFHSKTLFQKRVNSVSNYILTIYSPTFYYYNHFFVFSSLTHFLINVILDSDRFWTAPLTMLLSKLFYQSW